MSRTRAVGIVLCSLLLLPSSAVLAKKKKAAAASGDFQPEAGHRRPAVKVLERAFSSTTARIIIRVIGSTRPSR